MRRRPRGQAPLVRVSYHKTVNENDEAETGKIRPQDVDAVLVYNLGVIRPADTQVCQFHVI